MSVGKLSETLAQVQSIIDNNVSPIIVLGDMNFQLL